MPLSDAQRKYLRRLGHDRSPIVLVGQAGIGTNLVAELERALTDHELVKVRARVGDRVERNAILDELASATRSELVQRIGHVGLYYRRNPDKPGILLPAQGPQT
jgi:RNA-binding protein